MKKNIIFLISIIFLIILSFNFHLSPAFAFLPFGTPRVLTPPVYCLNGGVMVGVQSTIPPANPPGLYFVPVGSNRYLINIYPPFTGVKMLGKYTPGGVCLIPAVPTPIPIPTVGTVIEYGSAFGF